MSAPVQLLTSSLIEETKRQAEASPRRRINHNFHQSLEENPHRFLNVMLRDTYVRPHRHQTPPKSESFLLLEGAVLFLIFDDEGQVTERHVLGRHGVWGIDLPPGVWHSLAVLTDEAVCYEVKPGPYFASNDKEFASWAPAEDDPEAARYLAHLLSGA